MAPILETVPTARFRNAVFPGEQVGIEVWVTTQGSRWRAAATLYGPRGLAAAITLLYRLPGGNLWSA